MPDTRHCRRCEVETPDTWCFACHAATDVGSLPYAVILRGNADAADPVRGICVAPIDAEGVLHDELFGGAG